MVFTKLIQLSRFNQIVVKVRESLKLFKVPISCNLWILRECLFSVHDNHLFSGHDLIDLRLLSEPLKKSSACFTFCNLLFLAN